MDKSPLTRLSGLFSSSENKRYEARYTIVEAIVRRLGFRLYNRSLIWTQDPEYMDLRARFPGYQSSFIHERRITLYYLAKSVSSVSGDTAECGSYLGEGSFLITNANDCKKTHHIFDSFEGLSIPDAELDSSQNQEDYQWESGDLAITEDVVRNNLEGCGSIQYYQGWIPDRFEQVSGNEFSFVHVDVDLYQPTYDSIAFFYPRLVTGGILLCDDYGASTCPGAKKAFDDYCEQNGLNLVKLTTGQAYLVKIC